MAWKFDAAFNMSIIRKRFSSSRTQESTSLSSKRNQFLPFRKDFVTGKRFLVIPSLRQSGPRKFSSREGMRDRRSRAVPIPSSSCRKKFGVHNCGREEEPQI